MKRKEAFDEVSSRYGEYSIIQQSVARKLLEMLDLDGNESILDVGCGAGLVTGWLVNATDGLVVGTDVSPRMVEAARSLNSALEFRCIAAEDLDYREEFDVVFCSSVIQWFNDLERGIGAMRSALRSGGTLALVCPALGSFQSWWIAPILGAVFQKPEITEMMRHWRSPWQSSWLGLKTSDDFRDFFEGYGFRTQQAFQDQDNGRYSPEEAFSFYKSGVAQGFTVELYYETEIDREYIDTFNGAVREEIMRVASEASDGKVEVYSSRFFFIGQKP